MGLAESKFKVTTFLRQLLLADDKIVSFIDDKIFPIVAPKDTEGDFIIYQRDGYSKERTKMGVASQAAQVYVNVWSDDYDRSQEIAFLINECLEGTFKDTDDPDLSTTIKLTDSSEDFEDDKYIQILLFEIL